MSEIAPKAALAAFTRAEVERHGDDDWDGAHGFMTLHNVDGKIVIGMYAMITPDMPPEAYPDLMAKLAFDFGSKLADPADDTGRTDGVKLPPPCAYLLQIEAFMARLPNDASQAEREQFDRDGRTRKIHARPDAVEMVNAVCADVHGRLYSAIKRRDNGEIMTMFHGPLDKDGRLTGRFAAALLAIAHTTGMVRWGLPGPIPMSN